VSGRCERTEWSNRSPARGKTYFTAARRVLLLREEREEATVRIDPVRLYTWDFTPRMTDLSAAPSVTQGEPASPEYGHTGK